MVAHRILSDIAQAEWRDVDPGNGGTFNVTKTMAIPLVSAAAETRTLANPPKAGIFLLLYMKTDAGDITVTASTAYTQAGNTSLVFSDAGDMALLQSVESGSNFVWRLVAVDGATGPSVEVSIDLNGQEMFLDADADTSITADTDDTIDLKIGGADDFQFTANKFSVLVGSAIETGIDSEVRFGTTANDQGAILWGDSDASSPALVIAAGNDNQAVHICGYDERATDWNVSDQTHPRLYIHSATTPDTDYMTIGAFDGNTGIISVNGHGIANGLGFSLTGVARARVNDAGIGLTTSLNHTSTAGTNVLSIFNGTPPVGTLANGGSLYVDTVSDEELHYIDSAGNAAAISP